MIGQVTLAAGQAAAAASANAQAQTTAPANTGTGSDTNTAPAADNTDGPKKPTRARIWGVQVIKPPIGKGDDAIKPFGWYSFDQHGTALVIRVDHAQGGLLELDDELSKITSLVDDQGTNLLAGDFKYADPGDPEHVRLTKDGKSALVEIRGPKLPASSAKSVHLKGKLVFRAASKTKTFTQKSLSLTRGTTIKAGPIPFTISQVKPSRFDDSKMQVRLKCDKPFEALKTVTFHGPSGKVIKSKRRGSGRTTAQGRFLSGSISFELDTKIEKAKSIELTYWQNMHELAVPLDLQTSVGLD